GARNAVAARPSDPSDRVPPGAIGRLPLSRPLPAPQNVHPNAERARCGRALPVRGVDLAAARSAPACSVPRPRCRRSSPPAGRSKGPTAPIIPLVSSFLIPSVPVDQRLIASLACCVSTAGVESPAGDVGIGGNALGIGASSAAGGRGQSDTDAGG